MSRLHVDYRGGSVDLISGDTGQPGDGLMLTDPWGNEFFVMSGHKQDHGPGGFEFNAPPGRGYKISIGFSFWEFEHLSGMTFLTWEGQPQPTPSPSPEPASPSPSPSPEPPIPQEIRVEPGITYSARLQGDIIYYQEGMAEDAVWWFVGQHIPGADLWLPFTEPLTAELLAAWYGELRLRVERYGRAVAELRG